MSKLIVSNIDVEKIFQKKEVQEFWGSFKQIKRGTAAEFKVPDDIYDVVMELVNKYSKVYPLIEQLFPIKPGRIIIGNDVTSAEFKPDGEAVTLEDFSTKVEFDFENGFKVIKVIFIDNSLLDQQADEFQTIIIKRLAQAIGLALDDAILNGQGKENYQFEGIIKNIPAENNVGVTPASLSDIIKPISLLDSGEYNDNEIVAIVNRNTYYGTLLSYLLNCSNPGALPRFIFSYAMAEDQVLYADFSKYILVQRGNFVLERSRHARFPFDETGYKGRMNFDGKPGRPEAFVLVNLQ